VTLDLGDHGVNHCYVLLKKQKRQTPKSPDFLI